MNLADCFWSSEEELVIASIQEFESVPRAEAIRRMQRRKKASLLGLGCLCLNPEKGTRLNNHLNAPRPSAGRLCRNPRCTRGDDGGPGSLAHLRADALYCNATCKKAGQRSSKPEKRASNRQCLRGHKGDKSGALVYAPTPTNAPLKSPANAILKLAYDDSGGHRQT
jgi:hypothetical protein